MFSLGLSIFPSEEKFYRPAQIRAGLFVAFDGKAPCKFSIEKRQAEACRFLCLLNELFLALGAGDIDLTLALGNTYLLAAAGAGEIPVIPVFHFLKKLQKPLVFPIPLIGLPGEGTEDGPAQQNIRCQGKT